MKRCLLIDFDRVDITNLHRQQYKANQIGCCKSDALAENLLEIAPYTEIQTVTAKITEENLVHLLKDADIVCEAFDNAESKAMLVNGRQFHFFGQNGTLNAVRVFACQECDIIFFQ